MKTLTLKEFLKELQSYENTTKRGCKVYVVINEVRYYITKDSIDAYGDNTLRINLGN